MWREYISSLSDKAVFASPASWAVMDLAERALGVKFPDELRELLTESDGVEGEYGLGLLWPAERIHEDNLSVRSNGSFKDLYMPFDCLLFFADAGNGDQFAYPIQNGEIRRNDVFVWNHEDDSRTWVAPSLKQYFEWWPAGKLKW